jgi:outer membrane protein OmpA-like peptidoglycan-associated protein
MNIIPAESTEVHMHRTTSLTLLIGILSTIYGCSSTMPPRDAAVDSARRDFLVIAQEPYIQRYAPAAYADAKESMDEAERLWTKGASEEELEHQVYLTRKKVAIARETAGLSRAEEQVEQGDSRRKDVLLEAREDELQTREKEIEAARRRVEMAEQEAEYARTDAEQARTQAEQMQMQAGQLSQELSDLEAQQTERGLVITLNNILFDAGKSELKPGADNTLDKIADVLQEYSDHTLKIEGFTDSTGDDNYNESLSQLRAEAVKNALVQRGIGPDRIDTRGYGERYPIATNNTPTGRQLNRRVEIIVSNDQKPVDDRSS